jgi:ribosomal protein L28
VYAAVLARYFISSPTLLFRRQVYEELQGYDESLAYEDFDLLVRAARRYKFYFLDKPLTKRRLHPHQLSKRWYKVGDKQLLSTIKVCAKAMHLNQTTAEVAALLKRIKWEIKQAYFTRNFYEAEQLFTLYRQIAPVSGKYKLLEKLNRARLDLSFIQTIYYKLVHRR